MKPIDKAARALAPRTAMHPEDRYLVDDARAVFASIDTDELARAVTASLDGRPWRDLTPRAIAEAVKAHLLKEDS